MIGCAETSCTNVSRILIWTTDWFSRSQSPLKDHHFPIFQQVQDCGALASTMTGPFLAVNAYESQESSQLLLRVNLSHRQAERMAGNLMALKTTNLLQGPPCSVWRQETTPATLTLQPPRHLVTHHSLEFSPSTSLWVLLPQELGAHTSPTFLAHLVVEK